MTSPDCNPNNRISRREFLKLAGAGLAVAAAATTLPACVEKRMAYVEFKHTGYSQDKFIVDGRVTDEFDPNLSYQALDI
jgi:hypothetical protein